MSVVRRFLGFVFLLAIGVDLVILAWVGYAARHDRDALLMVRDACFTRFTSDPGVFALPPSKIPGFSADDPRLVEEWKTRLSEQVEYLREVRSESLPHETVARAKALVLLFSKNGGGDRLLR